MGSLSPFTNDNLQNVLRDYLPRDFQLTSACLCFVALAGESCLLRTREAFVLPSGEERFQNALEMGEIPAAGRRRHRREPRPGRAPVRVAGNPGTGAASFPKSAEERLVYLFVWSVI